MSKKHYIEIAKQIRITYCAAVGQAGHTALEELMTRLCVSFRAENPAFDSTRFIAACIP